MKVYIVEDDLFQLEDIKITLEELGHECVGHNDDPFQAQEEIGKTDTHVVLMDIHLHGKVAGIALARRVKELYNLPIIFTSSDRSTEIITDAADIAPAAYITKPINAGDLQAAMILAEKQQVSEPSETLIERPTELFVKSGKKMIRVEVKDILYAHTDTKNYCTLVTVDKQKLTFRNSILAFHQMLDPEVFVQTHRSYIINITKIECFHEDDQTIELQGDHVPVGRTFRAGLFKRMEIL